jgi:PAS domain S-box-containing protein
VKEKIRRSGIDAIGNLPWGTHFCQFYQTTEDLTDILVPYFKVGLENNEFCLWITSQPLEIEDAKEALKGTVPDLDSRLDNGQIEIIPYTFLHVTGSIYDSERVINYWIEKLNHALGSGYGGLRLSGNTSWLEKKNWDYFVNYMGKFDDIICKYRMIAMGSYFVDKYSTTEIIEIVSNHQFSLSKKEGKWERTDNFGRKKAEEVAARATKDWEHTFDAVPDLIAIIDTEYRVVRANKAMAVRFGVTPEECAGLTCYRIVHGTDEPPSFCPHLQLLRDGLEHTKEIHEDNLGGDFIVSVSPLHDSEGKLTGCIHVARDINERKRAEEALRQSEKRERARSDELVAVLDAVPVAVYIAHDPQALQITGNRLAYEWLRIPVGSNLSKSAPEGDRPETFRLFKGGIEIPPVEMPSQMSAAYVEINDIELDIVSVESEIRHVLGNARPLHDEQGNSCGSISAFIDITKRVKAEEALRLSNIYNRSLIEASLDPQVTIGREGKITDVNYATEQVTGYSRNKLIGTDFSDYFIEPEKARKGYQQVFTDGEVRNYSLVIQHKSGHITPVLYNASVYKDENGEIIGVFAAARDITERKKVEEALKKSHESLEEKVKERTTQLEGAYKSLAKSEKGLAEAQKMAHIGNWEWDIANDKAYWSKEMYRVFGRSLEKLAPPYNEFLSYIHPDDRDYFDNVTKKAVNGKPYSIDLRIVLSNGEERTIHMQSKVVFDEINIPIRVKGTIQDITEFRKAEEKIQSLANIVESSQDAIMTLSLDSIIVSWNKGAAHIYGYSAKEILGKNASILEPDNLKGEIKKLIERIKQGIMIKNYETTGLKKDDTPLNVSVTLSPIFDASGELTAISVIARDITERIKAEKFLVKAEGARKKEIHHRIKNNLQVISSLLDLQADKFNDPKVIEAFRESQSRVISMALIHEELYKEEETDTLNFSEYLKKLAENLFQTYKLSSKNIHLKMNLEENSLFNMDTAVPLGIIVNELVSNSLKHAFIGRDKGEIQIKLCREEKGKCKEESCKSINFILTVLDNGIGIPENLNIEDIDSLGLQLVTSLVDQLDGKFKLKRNNGTEFTMSFTITKK